VIWWQGAQGLLPGGRFDLAFSLRASNYRGQSEAQMEWLHARLIPETVPEIAVSACEQIVDLRRAADPLAMLTQHLSGDALLWQEGVDRLPQARNRCQFEPAQTLIIWNAPPGRDELLQALRAVRPKNVVLFAAPGPIDEPAEFLKRLTGMVRYALRARRGMVELNSLAAALNQRPSAVEAGLRWLAARGYIQIAAESLDQWELIEGGTPDPERLAIMERALRSILKETAAFRAFYNRADAEEILRLE
jgi:hypothetical protein